MRIEFVLLHRTAALCVLAFTVLSNSLAAPAVNDRPASVLPLDSFTKLPIKEVTVFKDGHAFIAHEGVMPTDADGNVVMDYLPSPVIGTFWPYSAEKGSRLKGVLAGHKRVTIDKTALNLRELLEANIGAQAIISEIGTNRYEATILGLPSRDSEELLATLPPNTEERLPEKGNLVMLKTSEGVKAIAVDRIQEIVFKQAPKPSFTGEEFRNLMTLQLDWNGSKPAASANVGLFYLQRGIRWIPSYKIEIGNDGKTQVKFQATLINELADLDDVSMNLVVGVPTFAFKNTLDPISLQQAMAQLSHYFQTDNYNGYSPLASQFGNAIMSQQIARTSDYRSAAPGDTASLSGDIGESGKADDLYIFNVPHVRLKKGERMTVFIADFTLPFQDIYTLELPYGPPAEIRCNYNNEQQREFARLLATPKVQHKIRLTNNSNVPLTTAPALLIREGKVLAQGLMTYAAPGSKVDLPVTTAIDFQVKKSDKEIKRKPNAAEENGNHYTEIDMEGKVTITSHSPKPVELEITRWVLGTVSSAGQDAKVDKLSPFENDDAMPYSDYPQWWGWYGWPSWWNYFNGIGRITWKLQIDPAQTAELDYQWHYYWR